MAFNFSNFLRLSKNKLKELYFQFGSKINREKSKKWFAGKLKSSRMLYKLGAKSGKPEIGNLYAYMYDAKWKDALPYWDKLPLTVIIAFYPDGFLGLNLHYLDIKNRIQLMVLLQSFGSNNKGEIKVSYQKLLTLSNTVWKHTVHRYLYKHLRSTPIRISQEDWIKTLSLPVNSFTKKSASYVWSQI